MFRVYGLSAVVIAASTLAVAGFRLAPAHAGCPLRGVWQIASLTIDGKETPTPWPNQRKLLTQRYFMWMGHQAHRDTLPLKTRADTLWMYSISGGGGTYTTNGNTYVEHIDMENDPSWLGTSFKATCRVEGNLWYHGFTIPNDTTKATGPVLHFVEVWRRVE